jgi:hypothetical protein
MRSGSTTAAPLPAAYTTASGAHTLVAEGLIHDSSSAPELTRVSDPRVMERRVSDKLISLFSQRLLALLVQKYKHWHKRRDMEGLTREA